MNDNGELEIVAEYVAAPSIEGKTLIIADPMLATGLSMDATYESLKGHGKPHHVHICCTIATPQAIDYLAEQGYDPDFGARPVKRAIQQFVLNDLSKKLLADEVDRTKPIIIDEYGEGLIFRN